MQAIKSKIRAFQPVLVLLYLSLMGFLGILSVQRYLGLPFEFTSSLTFMGIIFGVYTFNRFTDTVEDFTNDIGRLMFFEKRNAFLAVAVISLAASIGFLLYERKLNWMHFLLLSMGFCYSYRLIPWFGRKTGYHLVRIKDLTFLKNLAVSFLWGSSVFLVPILYSGIAEFDRGMIWLLGTGLFLSTLNNTLFDDILDEAGDRVAGIKTLPTTLGGRKSQILLMILDVIWLSAVSGLWGAGMLDPLHAGFLCFLGLYPFLYMGLHMGGLASKGLIDFLSETDLLFFALGMLLLSLR